ncbi:MAG TPA: DsbA family protein [Xanthobacteraceae bacterium]|nr:DsbA family protein [Xanthobacteraceae bacterium]
MLSRSEFTTGVSLLALCALTGLPQAALAQATVSTTDLAEPSAIGDMALGSDKAPVTIIEYASMTCSHCAHFAVTTFPKLKERYIDTGKVRYIFREFPLDPLAAGASLLARCADKDKYFSIVDLLFHTRDQWAIQNPIEPLFNVVKQAGFTREAFNACLDTKNNENSRKILAAIEAGRNRASDKFKVQSTPTFFINGKRVAGAISIEEIEKEILPLLKA